MTEFCLGGGTVRFEFDSHVDDAMGACLDAEADYEFISGNDVLRLDRCARCILPAFRHGLVWGKLSLYAYRFVGRASKRGDLYAHHIQAVTANPKHGLHSFDSNWGVGRVLEDKSAVCNDLLVPGGYFVRSLSLKGYEDIRST
ncbi:hypothetical protein [Micromonospora cathayae]|uniref:Uncharacterized protein n=1 Tax=Micromonospora cathayae TaxID=3028804 RepID=A0ABY7ZPE6_9ACTN|nr:hypothetical protein [Micromonospora sp. HUAS 3]WDZ84907.1 hypothetical protein PVK37_00030 [Micromonospora sp. HUAS 3]